MEFINIITVTPCWNTNGSCWYYRSILYYVGDFVLDNPDVRRRRFFWFSSGVRVGHFVFRLRF